MLQETDKDPELQALKKAISTGWPVKRSQIPSKTCILIGILEMNL